MELKCRINGKEYKLTQGVTFSEEYNETLDSGTIIISHIPKIEDIEPYDDVFIYDKEFNGYGRYELEYKDAIKFEKDQYGKIVIISEIPNDFIQALFSGDVVINQNIKLMFFQEEEEGFFVNSYSYCFIDKQGDSYYFVIEKINFKQEIVFNEEKNIWEFKRDDDIYIGNYDDVKVIDFKSELIYNVNKENTFYKHLLIDGINREELNLDEGIYKYTISLFSETKRLETIQLPNFSVTEPLKIELKKSIYDYMLDVVDMYSPLYKVIDNQQQKTWKYKKKYIIDPKLKEIFGDCYSPDFTLTNPNLRDVLSKLMIVKDMIPYVEDDVIKAMDITKRTDEFKEEQGDYKHINYVYSNINSGNYCNSLKTTYSDALSQERSCKLTEFLSFRNSSSPLLTLENMRLETTYPIYKINKMYMCYYKKFSVVKNNGDAVVKSFLCKQDISELVKLNSERNVLSEDWTSFNKKEITTVEQLAKYKIGTIGYNIGSNFIDGWGTKITQYQIFNWFPSVSTYIQKIYEFMDNFYPYGIYNYNYLKNKSNIKSGEYIQMLTHNLGFSDTFTMVTPFINNYPQGLKSLFFEIEYDAFYNGTIIHSKDSVNRDDIIINDNPSSSLTLLELDGIAQKEKINRFGNETFQINARYTDFNQIKPLGTVYNSKNKADTDVIIYSKEYSIHDNVINCKYVGAKDYVLKNYFTSVYAKHRPYNLMSYEESVYRSENKKVYLLLDLEKKYIENNKDVLSFENFGFEGDVQSKNELNYISKIFSFIKKSVINQKNNISNKDKINYGFFVFQNNKYASDVNVFNSGNSLCFNIKMFDNVSAGVHIDVENLEPFTTLEDFVTVEDDVKGSLQEWYLTVDNNKTGFVERMGFYVGHVEKSDYIDDGVIDDESIINGKELKDVTFYDFNKNKDVRTEKVSVLKGNTIYKKIFELPKIMVENKNISNLIGNEFLINKDNKEIIDMTFQIEPITLNNDKILFSPWIMKLSDLNGNYNKIHKDFNVADDNSIISEDVFISTIESLRTMKREGYFTGQPGGGNLQSGFFPIMILEINEENVDYDINNPYNVTIEDALKKTPQLDTSISFSYVKANLESPYIPNDKYYEISRLNIILNKITVYNKEEGYLILEGEQQLNWTTHKGFPLGIGNKNKVDNFEVSLKFEKVDKVSMYNIETGKNDFYIYAPEGKIWFVYDTYQKNLEIPDKKENYEVEYTLKTNDGKRIEYDDYSGFNLRNSNIVKTYFNGSASFKYLQNLFITTSSVSMKNYQIYNQYKDIKEIGLSLSNTGPLVSDVLYFSDDDILTVDLYSFDPKTTKCVQLWYKDEGGAFNFVFGVNVDEEDFDKRRLEIHVSLLTHKDMRVFDDLHNVVGEVKNIANINEEEEYRDKYLQKYVAKED